MTTRHFSDGSPIDVPDNTGTNDTATLGTVGIQGGPTLTLSYQKIGNQVQAVLGAVSGTSTLLNTALQLTGVPAAIRPSSARFVSAVYVISGGLTVLGTLRMNTDGTADLFAGVIGTVLSALGVKGVPEQQLAWLI